jgi:hypothetical protein
MSQLRTIVQCGEPARKANKFRYLRRYQSAQLKLLGRNKLACSGRTGRFPQLVDPRSRIISPIFERFVRVSLADRLEKTSEDRSRGRRYAKRLSAFRPSWFSFLNPRVSITSSTALLLLALEARFWELAGTISGTVSELRLNPLGVDPAGSAVRCSLAVPKHLRCESSRPPRARCW